MAPPRRVEELARHLAEGLNLLACLSAGVELDSEEAVKSLRWFVAACVESRAAALVEARCAAERLIALLGTDEVSMAEVREVAREGLKALSLDELSVTRGGEDD